MADEKKKQNYGNFLTEEETEEELRRKVLRPGSVYPQHLRAGIQGEVLATGLTRAEWRILQSSDMPEHGITHESGGADEISHDNLKDFEADEHINWKLATDNLITSGDVRCQDVQIYDTNTSNYLEIHWGEDDTSNRQLSLNMNAGNRVVDLAANLYVESNSYVNQDLTTDADVDFGSIVTTGDVYVGGYIGLIDATSPDTPIHIKRDDDSMTAAIKLQADTATWVIQAAGSTISGRGNDLEFWKIGTGIALSIDWTNRYIGFRKSNAAFPLDINFSTNDLGLSDAGLTGGTEAGWIEVDIGGSTRYIRVFSTK